MTVLQYTNRPAPLAAPPAVALLGNEPAGAGLHFAADQHWICDPATPANCKLATTDALMADGTMPFSRNTPATNWGRLGVIETVASNVPRLAYDPLSVVTSTATVQFRRGVRAVTVSAGYTYAAGSYIALTDTGTPARWMRGRVVSHVGTLLVVDIYWVSPGATGSAPAWTIIKSMGYLPEPARSNLLSYSGMGGSGWTPINATRGSSPIMDPWGGYNATLITATATPYARIQSSTGISMTAATAYSLSILVYAGTATALHGTVELSGTETLRFFGRVSDGAASAVAVAGPITYANPKMIQVGNGWWLYTIAVTPGATGAHSVFVGPASAYGGASVTIGDTIHFSDVQVEAGVYPTSLILTAGSQVSRSADTLYIVASKLPSMTSALTVISASRYVLGSINGAPYGLYNVPTAGADRAGVSFLANGTINGFVRSNDVVVRSINSPGAMPTYTKTAMSLDGSEMSLVANGAAVGKGAAPMIPIDRIEVGYRAAGERLCAPLDYLVLIPRALSDAEKITRTTL